MGYLEQDKIKELRGDVKELKIQLKSSSLTPTQRYEAKKLIDEKMLKLKTGQIY